MPFEPLKVSVAKFCKLLVGTKADLKIISAIQLNYKKLNIVDVWKKGIYKVVLKYLFRTDI